MAIERTELSGSLNGSEMAPVASTPAIQNQASPEPEESQSGESGSRKNQPRGRESAAKKDSERGKSSPNASGMDEVGIEQVEKVEQSEPTQQVAEDGPPHRVDSLA